MPIETDHWATLYSGKYTAGKGAYLPPAGTSHFYIDLGSNENLLLIKVHYDETYTEETARQEFWRLYLEYHPTHKD